MKLYSLKEVYKRITALSLATMMLLTYSTVGYATETAKVQDSGYLTGSGVSSTPDKTPSRLPTYEEQELSDGEGDNYEGSTSLSIEVQANREILSVTLPSVILLQLNSDGRMIAPTNAKIKNNVTDRKIQVNDISVDLTDSSWDYLAYSENLRTVTENSKALGLRLRNDDMDTNGNFSLTASDWVIDEDASLDLNIKAKMPKQTVATLYENVAVINFSIGWADSSITPDPGPDEPDPPKPGTKYNITFTEPENGTLDSLDGFQTNEDGVIEFLPTATPDEGYRFVRFEDADGNEVKVGDTLTSDVELKAVFEVDESKVKLEFNVSDTTQGEVTSKPIYVDKNTTWGDIEKPEVTAKPGYKFEGFYDAEGNKITDSTIITSNMVIILKFEEVNPSDGLIMTMPEAQAQGFTFSAYKDGLQVTGFNNTNFLSTVTVPEQVGDFKVLKVGDNAFKKQSNIKNFNLPSTVVEIGNYAFSDCASLRDVVLDSNILYGEYVYSGCTSIERIEIPLGLDVTKGMFMGCTGLLELVYNEKDTLRLADMAFYNCENLSTIVGSTDIEVYGLNSFAGCTSLTNVDVEYSGNDINTNIFRDTYFKSITFTSTEATIHGIPSVGVDATTILDFTQCKTVPKSIHSPSTEVYWYINSPKATYTFSGQFLNDSLCYRGTVGKEKGIVADKIEIYGALKEQSLLYFIDIDNETPITLNTLYIKYGNNITGGRLGISWPSTVAGASNIKAKIKHLNIKGGKSGNSVVIGTNAVTKMSIPASVDTLYISYEGIKDYYYPQPNLVIAKAQGYFDSQLAGSKRYRGTVSYTG